MKLDDSGTLESYPVTKELNSIVSILPKRVKPRTSAMYRFVSTLAVKALIKPFRYDSICSIYILAM